MYTILKYGADRASPEFATRDALYERCFHNPLLTGRHVCHLVSLGKSHAQCSLPVSGNYQSFAAIASDRHWDCSFAALKIVIWRLLLCCRKDRNTEIRQNLLVASAQGSGNLKLPEQRLCPLTHLGATPLGPSAGIWMTPPRKGRRVQQPQQQSLLSRHHPLVLLEAKPCNPIMNPIGSNPSSAVVIGNWSFSKAMQLISQEWLGLDYWDVTTVLWQCQNAQTCTWRNVATLPADSSVQLEQWFICAWLAWSQDMMAKISRIVPTKFHLKIKAIKGCECCLDLDLKLWLSGYSALYHCSSVKPRTVSSGSSMLPMKCNCTFDNGSFEYVSTDYRWFKN